MSHEPRNYLDKTTCLNELDQLNKRWCRFLQTELSSPVSKTVILTVNTGFKKEFLRKF